MRSCGMLGGGGGGGRVVVVCTHGSACHMSQALTFGLVLWGRGGGGGGGAHDNAYHSH